MKLIFVYAVSDYLGLALPVTELSEKLPINY